MKIVPRLVSAIYSAALHIRHLGPQSRDELFAAVNFGFGSNANNKLKYAFEIDWLHQTIDGKIDLTESTRQHFAPKEATAPYVGKEAAPAYRGNVFATAGLSKKYLTNSRGPRADVPAWSVREKASFHTKA